MIVSLESRLSESCQKEKVSYDVLASSELLEANEYVVSSRYVEGPSSIYLLIGWPKAVRHRSLIWFCSCTKAVLIGQTKIGEPRVVQVCE